MSKTFQQTRKEYLHGLVSNPSNKEVVKDIRRCGSSRKKMVDYITDDRGYWDRYERFAIEWDVSAYMADLDEDRLDHWIAKFRTEGHLSVEDEDCEAFTAHVRELYETHKDHMFSWGTEGAWDMLVSSDVYNVAPIPSMPALAWTPTLRGRGGKHLCVEKFAGINVKQPQDDLEADLMEKDSDGDWVIPHSRVIELFLLCAFGQQWFTPESASEAVEHEAWWTLIVNIAEATWKE